MKIQAEDFWKFFQQNSDSLMDIDSLEKKQADELLEKTDKVLKQYSEGIDFELGDLTTKGRTLTFTAHGDTDYFDDLISLCENAPILDFWDITAFKPAKGNNAAISHGKYRLKTADMWFRPMENPQDTEHIGLQIGWKRFEKEDEELLVAVYSLLEALLGEYDCATLLDYFELSPLPENPQESDWIPLKELPQYAEWFLNS